MDPVDGTNEFINRNGEFCINLALIEGTAPVEGWIYWPVTGKGWYCRKGKGIFEFDGNGSLKEVKQSKATSKKIRIVASRSFFSKEEAFLIEKIGEKYPAEVIFKGSSIKQTDIAAGKADIYLKTGSCYEWDTAPGQLMIEESGGTIFRLDNFQPLSYNKPILKNPHFVMLSANLQSTEFKEFLKIIIRG